MMKDPEDMKELWNKLLGRVDVQMQCLIILKLFLKKKNIIRVC